MLDLDDLNTTHVHNETDVNFCALYVTTAALFHADCDCDWDSVVMLTRIFHFTL